MFAPPGIVFIVRVLPQLIFYPAVVYAAILIARDYRQVLLPTWATIILCALAQPTFLYTKSYYNRRRVVAYAKSRGAVLPPSVQGGGITILRRLVNSFASDYVCACLQSVPYFGGLTPSVSGIFTAMERYIRTYLRLQRDRKPGQGTDQCFHCLTCGTDTMIRSSRLSPNTSRYI